MLNRAKVEPIKTVIVPVGSIVAGAGGTGETVLRLTSPSRQIHWTLQVGWVVPLSTVPDVSGSMSVYPMMRDPQHGSSLIRMQPVLSGGTLPDGYEAESGVKDWEAVLQFAAGETNPGRIFAVVTWEPSLIDMCEEERAYWAGLCNAQLAGGSVSVGGSL